MNIFLILLITPIISNYKPVLWIPTRSVKIGDPLPNNIGGGDCRNITEKDDICKISTNMHKLKHLQYLQNSKVSELDKLRFIRENYILDDDMSPNLYKGLEDW